MDCTNDYQNTMFTRDSTPYRVYKKMISFTSISDNYTPHRYEQSIAKRQPQKDASHNRQLSLRAVPLSQKSPPINISSQIQYVNRKIKSPFYLNYFYIIGQKFCEGTLRNFDPMKINYLFGHYTLEHIKPFSSPSRIKCVVGRYTKCIQGLTFNLLWSALIADQPVNREPSRRKKISKTTFCQCIHIIIRTFTLGHSLHFWRVIFLEVFPASWKPGLGFRIWAPVMNTVPPVRVAVPKETQFSQKLT